MENVPIAKIAVSAAPYAIDKPYDYLIPAPLLEKALVGTRVTVPFGRGNRTSEGVILACITGVKTQGLKPIAEVLDESPVLDDKEIAMAYFLRQRYFCTMYEAVRTILPTGLWYRFREVYRVSGGLEYADALKRAGGIANAETILKRLYDKGGVCDSVEWKDLPDNAAASLKALLKAGILTSETEALRKIGDRTKKIAELSVGAEDALLEADRKQRSAPLRSEVLRLLANTGKAAASDLCYYTGASMRTIRSLEKAGFLTLTEEEALRVPENRVIQPGAPIVLNEEQTGVFQNLMTLLSVKKPAAALIEGVTGSGKTEIYIRLVQETLKQGRTAMVLVPEIVLTPQMMRKFSSYFGNRVVMLHSSLKLSERYDQWKRIRRGEVEVVLGTRSAVFSPLKNLGLLILDEEQESSYQSENPPRYHARDVAKFRCAQDNALLLLGSATPSVESAWSAREGIYQYNLLRKRYNEKALPQVTIADLREEVRSGNPGAVGRILQQELEKNLASGEQSILFLNRRGSSRMLLCGECGYVPTCPRCSVPMTYHSANGRLMCHYCGHSQRAEETCPECGGYMKHIGTGTQKVEQELKALFPNTEILRMDADTVGGGHEKLLRKFEKERIPILLGTQMVAKGLDFENVTLVGVISADLSLYVDSYRAAERTFSLLTQVVGRAGRGTRQGRAVIQTYTPENEVIRSAAEQDYDRFYESEIRLRRLRRYPPFADLFTFTISGGEEGAVLRAAVQFRENLVRDAARPGQSETPEILGPAPAPILKVNNNYRYHVTLVGKNDRAARELIAASIKHFCAQKENRKLHIFADCNAMD
jgi:primosomal protein N' (replication factor Y)